MWTHAINARSRAVRFERGMLLATRTATSAVAHTLVEVVDFFHLYFGRYL